MAPVDLDVLTMTAVILVVAVVVGIVVITAIYHNRNKDRLKMVVIIVVLVILAVEDLVEVKESPWHYSGRCGFGGSVRFSQGMYRCFQCGLE